jgi:hypothetical protein
MIHIRFYRTFRDCFYSTRFDCADAVPGARSKSPLSNLFPRQLPPPKFSAPLELVIPVYREPRTFAPSIIFLHPISELLDTLHRKVV